MGTEYRDAKDRLVVGGHVVSFSPNKGGTGAPFWQWSSSHGSVGRGHRIVGKSETLCAQRVRDWLTDQQPVVATPAWRRTQFDALLNPDIHTSDAAPLLTQPAEYLAGRKRAIDESTDWTASLIIAVHRVTHDVQVVIDKAHGNEATWKSRVSKMSHAGYVSVVYMVSTPDSSDDAKTVENALGTWVDEQVANTQVGQETWYVDRNDPDYGDWLRVWLMLAGEQYTSI
jgi:hypothetical protein